MSSNSSKDDSNTIGYKSSNVDLKAVRDEFVRAVDRAVENLVSVGCHRETAVNLLLSEMGAFGTPQQEEKLDRAKLHFKLPHLQATRALAVSTALQTLLREKRISLAEAIQTLTVKINAMSSMNLSAMAMQVRESTPAIEASTMRKKSEISLPEIPKQQSTDGKQIQQSKTLQQSRACGSEIKSPSKRGKLILSASTKGKSARKRTLDEQQLSSPSEEQRNETRSRSDSVTEEVSAKMQKQQLELPLAGNSEKNATSTRAKRSRGSSMEETETGPIGKRTRSATG